MIIFLLTSFNFSSAQVEELQWYVNIGDSKTFTVTKLYFIEFDNPQEITSEVEIAPGEYVNVTMRVGSTITINIMGFYSTSWILDMIRTGSLN